MKPPDIEWLRPMLPPWTQHRGRLSWPGDLPIRGGRSCTTLARHASLASYASPADGHERHHGGADPSAIAWRPRLVAGPPRQPSPRELSLTFRLIDVWRSSPMRTLVRRSVADSVGRARARRSTTPHHPPAVRTNIERGVPDRSSEEPGSSRHARRRTTSDMTPLTIGRRIPPGRDTVGP